MSKKDDNIKILLDEFRKEQNEFKKERDEFKKELAEFRKKMTKKNKKFVILVVTLFFIFIGTTYAASQMLASDVNFTPRDATWNVDNAEAAINDLYYKVPGVPTGTILPFMGNTAPQGYVICDGTEYNISSHSNLAEFIKTQFGSYNYFGGDGETTFAVPDLRGEFLRGSGKTGGEVGLHQSDGLPDINGTLDANIFWSYGGNSGTGVFKTTTTSFTKNYGGGTSGSSGTIKFNASDSNSIYGATTEVRPKNTSVLYIIKY